MNIRQLEEIATLLGGIFSLQQLQLYEYDFLRSNLVRRQRQGYIRRITKGWYSLATTIYEQLLFTYSNRIYTPSYVSMESALRYYDLIPEGVYMTTACTTKKTQQLQGDVGVFSYSHIKPGLMRGYQIVQSGGYTYKIAQPQKALCDLLYLKPYLKTQQDIDDLRIDTDQLFTLISQQDLIDCAKRYNNKRVSQLIDFLFLAL